MPSPRIYLVDYSTSSDDRVTWAAAFASPALAMDAINSAVAGRLADNPTHTVIRSRFRIETLAPHGESTTWWLYSLPLVATPADVAHASDYQAEPMDRPARPVTALRLAPTARA